MQIYERYIAIKNVEIVVILMRLRFFYEIKYLCKSNDFCLFL